MADVILNDGADDVEERIYESVMTCEPALAAQDVSLLADLVGNKPAICRPWRLTALLAGKSGEFYRELATSEPLAQAFAATPDCLRDFAARLREVADLADCVSARVMVAGCNHPRFDEWAAAQDDPLAVGHPAGS